MRRRCNASGTKQCAACDSLTTFIKKDGYPQWHSHDGYWLCQKCFDEYVWHPYRNKIDNPKWNQIIRGRKFVFKYRTIILPEKPRKGQCDLCGRKIGDPYINCEGKLSYVKITSRHHFAEYHDDDPLKETIEVCNSCHMKESWRLGQVKPRKFYTPAL